MSQMSLRFYRIMAEFSNGGVINELVTAKDRYEAETRLEDLIKRVLSFGGQELVAGSECVSLQAVISNNYSLD